MPKQIITLDSSQIVAFRKCPRYWFYSYKQNLRSPYAKQRAADMGTLAHLLLQMYYTMRVSQPTVDKLKHSEMAVAMFKKLWDSESRVKYKFTVEEITFLTTRFTQYVFQYYNNDFTPAKTKSGLPGVEIGFSKILYEDTSIIFVVEGRLDFLGYMSGINLWGDHKTQAQSRVLYQYRPQFLTYSWATGFDYALINYFGMQKEFSQKTFHHQIIHFPKWRIDAWKEEMHSIFWQIKKMLETVSIMDYNKPVDDAFPMQTTSCGGSMDYFPCVFSRICETQDQETKEAIKKNYFYQREKWQPWSLEEEVETT